MIFSNLKDKKIETKKGVLILVAFSTLILGGVFFAFRQAPGYEPVEPSAGGGSLISADNGQKKTTDDIKKFSSEEDFKNYLLASSLNNFNSSSRSSGTSIAMEKSATTDLAAPAASAAGAGNTATAQSATAQRVSQTNVQVAGIDEPDIVKTDGKEIYYSSESPVYWYSEGITKESIMPYAPSSGQTKLVKAFPADELALDGKIDKNGNLLLQNGILMVFSSDAIAAYDVKDPKAPKSLWDLKLGSQNYMEGARLYNDKVYLVTRNQINELNPCPIRPLVWGKEESLTIACDKIYHPEIITPVDSIYNAIVLDPQTGKIEKNISFTGSSGNSLVYMSEKGIYITYTYSGDPVNFFYQFLIEKAKDLFPARISEKIARLQSYDISSQSKMTELGMILQQYLGNLDQDEQMRIQNEVQNRLADYYKEKIREVEKTGIVKIDLDDFELSASGVVPGSPLNQFSLDEYKGNLRVAVTSGQNPFWWGFGSFGSGSSGSTANDVYILNSDLKKIGSALDLSKGWNDEKIYSVRFLEDKGYVVTFKETDPLTVLDLANPLDPEIAGQLEIPGYSAYLHPLAPNKILGLGKEDFKIKLSLFDVSDASNPKEISKYSLDEYWSEAVENHHAFLQDEKNQVVFLPGSKGGYIFSYKNDELELVRTVSGIQVKRAVYLDNYLYIIGPDSMVVLDESNWKKVKELSL
ncbi:MAG: beta-propeller domain-containing protein [Candidatus Paceibacterota bacterium]|jgi:uncharacterized secreted protein with C-terminal beta-propeller domain